MTTFRKTITSRIKTTAGKVDRFHDLVSKIKNRTQKTFIPRGSGAKNIVRIIKERVGHLTR